ncbi:hypothetical protein ScPMuIL_017260 [Solemya velum]
MADSRSGSATREITYFLNVENAKLLALCMVTGFIMYHGVIHFKYGSDSCQWLLSDGRFPGYNIWQPYGCMMHEYSKEDARRCMHYISYWGGRNHIAFLGDSRIRQLYFAFANLLSKTEISAYKAWSDLSFTDSDISLKVEFLWHPMVNISMYNVYKSWLMNQPNTRPNKVVTGSATWCIKKDNGSKTALDNYRVNLTLIRPFYAKLKDSTDILWMLQDPVVEEKLNGNRSMITNEQIDSYNRVALEELEKSVAQLWSSSRLVAQGLKKESVDGIHMSDAAIHHDIQMLLNSYCNDKMNHYDGTCCSSAEPVTTLQIVTASLFLVCLISSVALYIYRRRARRNVAKSRAENGQRNGQPPVPAEPLSSCWDIVFSLAKLGVIMAYIFLCDRTNFFMKENKYYTHVNFFLPFAYVMVLGFFFTENTDKVTVLHRDQTDEWKGWMQLVILIYHLTGASKVLPIYMHIRVLVSAYLFMTGYGHFMYFWNKGEYGLARFCQVIFRMNFLVVVLCFVMDRPYQFYYFVPLVSYWYMVVYITMAVWPHLSKSSAEANQMHYVYMLLKFLVLVTVITLLFLSEVFFERIFLVHPIKHLFVTSDDSIHEWRFRWSLDRYSVVYGMLFAFGYFLLKKKRLLDDDNPDTLFSRGVSWLLVSLGVLGIGGYATFSILCKNKYQCNAAHSYIVFVPILSFVLIRNVPGILRTKYSSFFAWFGRISLELFISQYHIWLAADTHGVLVLIPSYPVLNVIITSFIFICASHEINRVTSVLVAFAVPTEWKALLRNILAFLAILLPVAIVNGVF